ncbi:MAG: cupin domain-containing protein [Pseudomonadota bacterium]
MSEPTPLTAAPHDDAAAALQALLSTSLAPIDPEPVAEAGLRARLFNRVARSAQANASFVNVRKGDGAWHEASPGVCFKLLHEAYGVVSRLVRLDSGAQWSLADVGVADELLVLSGDLHIDGQKLGAQDYRLRGTDAPAATAQAPGGALVYWRRSTNAETAFGGVRTSVTVPATDTQSWSPLRPGVLLKPLFGVGDTVSMLARLEKGGSVPTHVHPCAEECLMIEGDMFLGDVLLLEGEYQWAPGGTSHDTLSSDVGCVVFIHGSVDPALKQEA